MSIRSVLFDADGVVIHPWRFRDYLKEQHGITPSMTREFFTGVFLECLVDKTRLRDVLPPYLETWGWPGSVGDFIAVWLQVENAPDERILAVISGLRSEGLRCCLASSQERNRARFMAAEMGFDGIFDEQYYSCHMGYQKPQPEFYGAVQSALGLSGGEILFWDDSEKNVTAARAAGWHAEVYLGFDDFEARIGELLAGRSIRRYGTPDSQSDISPAGRG